MINSKVRPYLENEDDTSDPVIVQKLYGPHVHPINPSIAKQAIGKRIQGLSGQDLFQPESRKDKIKQVERLTIHGFETDEDRPAQKIYQDGDSLIVSFEKTGGPFQVYECGKGLWGTGSGCDTVYVFYKTKKSLQRSKRSVRRSRTKYRSKN